MKDANVQEGFDGQPHCWTSPEQRLLKAFCSTTGHWGLRLLYRSLPAESNIISFTKLDVLDAGVLSGCVNIRGLTTQQVDSTYSSVPLGTGYKEDLGCFKPIFKHFLFFLRGTGHV